MGITDCKDDGCGKCQVCKYLDFIEMAENTGGNREGNTIQRNPEIEKHLDKHYQHCR